MSLACSSETGRSHVTALISLGMSLRSLTGRMDGHRLSKALLLLRPMWHALSGSHEGCLQQNVEMGVWSFLFGMCVDLHKLLFLGGGLIEFR